MDHGPQLAGVKIEAMSRSGSAAQWCLKRYFEELDQQLADGLTAKDVLTDRSEFSGPRSLFLVASADGQWVGCGGLKCLTSESACIKRMWVDKSWRGLGLGRLLLALLESHAKELGYTVVKLEANRLLQEAIQLYRTQGYRETIPFIEERCAECWHWLEKAL